ncbi:MAG TPA: hypothetical protein VHY91_17670 [Pirellulales bacterium]|jgi:hypothetical protein|nr:hypothetical protein [Pirellulales bacterium]
MSGGAHVDSFEVVRDFRAAVATFADEARDALAIYDLELRRTLDWLLTYQPQAWQQEVRNAEEAVRVAKIELGRCRSQKLPGGGEPSCMEEKKILERAKRRQQFAEEKLIVTRKWGQTFNRDATQYTSQASQLGDLFDSELPRALSLLDRVLLTLEAYVGLGSGMSRSAPSQSSGSAVVAASGQPAPAAASAADPESAEADATQENSTESASTPSSPDAASDQPSRQQEGPS